MSRGGYTRCACGNTTFLNVAGHDKQRLIARRHMIEAPAGTKQNVVVSRRTHRKPLFPSAVGLQSRFANFLTWSKNSVKVTVLMRGCLRKEEG